jgi:hypothetical protein
VHANPDHVAADFAAELDSQQSVRLSNRLVRLVDATRPRGRWLCPCAEGCAHTHTKRHCVTDAGERLARRPRSRGRGPLL